MSESGEWSWAPWVAMTVINWGLYGILLHMGQVAMQDSTHGRYKAFLFVGVAYLLVAVLAPMGLLLAKGVPLTFTSSGIGLSLAAGTVGAIGAFGVLLAFGAGGRPAIVMSLVFAGAPVVNAVVATTKAGLWGQIRWPFVLGLALAALGAFLVVRFKPAPPVATAAVEGASDAKAH